MKTLMMTESFAKVGEPLQSVEKSVVKKGVCFFNNTVHLEVVEKVM